MLDPQPSTTKTGRERAVDLSSEVVTILGAIKARRGARAMARGWRPMPPWVFVTRNGTPYSQRNVNRDFMSAFSTTSIVMYASRPSGLK